ncbi:MAG TPA: hypothetical protein VKU41_08070 [Polyangiaceae bacterium]|nr:hypothetical protein [Polyangiaceae bacterium]
MNRVWPEQKLTHKVRAGTISSMHRAAVMLTVCALAGAPGSAGAADAAPTQAEPGADQIQFAAQEHDLGYRAYVERRYDEAATHFENAFFAAPNPAELRSAIRARREGGDLARAATLAGISERRFPSDPASAQLAADVIAQARPKVYEVRLVSPTPCSVAVDEKAVTNERLSEVHFFVSSGKHELLVSWADTDRSERVPLEAAAGGAQTLRFAPSPPAPPPPASPPSSAPTTVPPPSASAPAPPAQASLSAGPGAKPLAPPVFVTAAALTAVGLGVTIWSGVDALNNPGPDAVRRSCVGQGESCSAYQQGLSAQRRTNILVGVTAGGALVSAVLGVFFTQWSPRRHPATGARVEPVLGPGQVALVCRF